MWSATIWRGDDMLKWIKAKLAAARNYFDAEDFRRGYDQAAGELLRGGTVLSLIDDAISPDYADGVLAASTDFHALLDAE
jgi:cytosine/adenosine deaminase-related metal-dependent hydrolase